MKSNSTQTSKMSWFAKMLGALGLLLMLSNAAMAQVTYTDSVCAGTQDKVYGITGAVTTSTYTWYISNSSAGTIDNSITTNDSEIQIDWGTTVGTYTLYVVETTGDGCTGDSVMLDVVVNPLPTATIVADSVCSGYSATLTLNLTGQAPWTVDYSDGTNTYTANANTTPYTVALPAYTTSQTITITGVTDGHNCDADNAGLPSTGVTIFPKPTTGAIYHY